ncbi:hypothetical protein ACWY4P_25745 [Streptomyces sp. LZ34]
MSSQRDASRIPGGTVRATVLSVLRCAVPLLTVALWLAPSFLHPAIKHASVTEYASATEHTSAAEYASATEHSSGSAHRTPRPAKSALARPCPDPGDNCVAGPRGVSQGLVPAPVPPPALAELLPRDRPHDTDATRAPPDHAVRAPGLHQLQVLRT